MKPVVVQHLTEDDTHKKAINDYWELTEEDKFNFKIIDITNKYDLQPPQISELIDIKAIAYSSKYACEVCKKPYIFRNRSHFSKTGKSFKWTCEECHESANSYQINQKCRILEKNFTDAMDTSGKIDVTDRSLIELLYLISVIRYSGTNLKTEITPYESIDGLSLSPSSEIDSLIYKTLIDKKIIAINPIKNIERVQYIDSENIDYDWQKVSWVITVHGYATVLEKTIEKIENKLINKQWSGIQFDEAKNITEFLLINEAINFAYKLSGKNNFYISQDHYLSIFEFSRKLIRTQTISQICMLIYQAGMFANNFFLEKKRDAELAGSVFIKTLDTKAKNVINEQREVKPLNLSSKHNSTINKLWFNEILCFEGQEFNMIADDLL
ncbi:MAG: hypothetical protein QJT81_16410 [Candidatus Thiothrix putei]|uniref:Uncharacterized protein n=1 Tax=Candidatus Thiothrix putei TaxID=3080811 RepID=A0AA95KN48_9GAMM|nr:MAG: hypothetical protein QJT81_16410 [Candidatus Thiothrix putei]